MGGKRKQGDGGRFTSEGNASFKNGGTTTTSVVVKTRVNRLRTIVDSTREGTRSHHERQSVEEIARRCRATDIRDSDARVLHSEMDTMEMWGVCSVAPSGEGPGLRPMN